MSSKRYAQAVAKVDPNTPYQLDRAITLLQELPPVKFEGRPDPASLPNAIRLQKVD